MENADIITNIMESIEKVADISQEEMACDSAFVDDLDMSSLECMLLISELEKIFSIKIPAKKLRELFTIQDMANYISNEII